MASDACSICTVFLGSSKRTKVTEIVELLEALLVQPNWKLLEELIICDTCLMKVQSACKFKASYLENSKKLYIKNEDIENGAVCEICKENVSSVDCMPMFYSVTENDKLNLFKFLYPELQLKSRDSPQTCELCHTSILNFCSVVKLFSVFVPYTISNQIVTVGDVKSEKINSCQEINMDSVNSTDDCLVHIKEETAEVKEEQESTITYEDFLCKNEELDLKTEDELVVKLFSSFVPHTISNKAVTVSNVESEKINSYQEINMDTDDCSKDIKEDTAVKEEQELTTTYEDFLCKNEELDLKTDDEPCKNMYYTVEERIEIINWYKGENSMRIVRDMFAAKYPNRQIPSIGTIHNIINSITTQGSGNRNRKKKTKLTEELQLNILCYVEEHERVSLREVANVFDVSLTSVFSILKRYKHMSEKSNLQKLLEEDKIRRVEFCETFFNLINENETILENIVFTDEASFSTDGTVNSRNYRSWPRLNLTNSQYYTRQVNVWAGIVGNVLLGPYFIEGYLDSSKYVSLLQHHIMPQIQNLNLIDPWFLMDEAPVHSTAAVTNYLDDNFPGRWIGRFSPAAWPIKSPDLSPNDFFLWGYLKSKVYDNTVIENIEELKNKIQTACDILQRDPQMLLNCVREFYNRLAYCLECNGGRFEKLL